MSSLITIGHTWELRGLLLYKNYKPLMNLKVLPMSIADTILRLSPEATALCYIFMLQKVDDR